MSTARPSGPPGRDSAASGPDGSLGRVGGYALLARIGEGGMGVVYLAQRADGGRVALKLLRPQVVGDEEGRRRLSREVASLGKVRSPHVAEVLDADPWGVMPYVVTRYVPGISLHQQVRVAGPLAEDDLRHVGRVLLCAVRDVHAADVLHRDVKPSNVLLEGRSPVLIDFGLARLAEDPRMTAAGWLLGTPGYLAPEVVWGDDASTAADVHAWAATLVYAATGASPYGSGHPMAILDRLRSGLPRLAGVPASLRPLLADCLAHEPLERPTTTEALAALAALSSGGASHRVGGQPGVAEVPPTAPWQVAMAADLAGAATQVAPGDGAGRQEDARPTTVFPPVTTPYTVARPAPVESRASARTALPPAPSATTPRPWPPSAPPGWSAPRPAPPVRSFGPGRGSPVPPSAAPSAGPQPGWQQPGQQQHRVPASSGAVLRRRFTLAGLFTSVAAGFAAAPAACLVVVGVVVLLVRGQSRTAEAAWMRRLRRGRRRWYDPVLTVLGYPWHVLGGSVGSVVLVVAAGLAALLVAGALLVLGVPEAAAFGAGGVALAWAVWSGPGSGRVRRPVRRVVDRSSRDPWSSAVALVLVATLTTALLAYAVARGPRRDLWPSWLGSTLQTPVDVRLDLPAPALSSG